MNKGIWGPEERVSKAIVEGNKIYKEEGMDLEKTKIRFLKTKFAELWGAVKDHIEPLEDDGGTTISDKSGKILQPEKWYRDPGYGDDSYWERYLDLLLRKGWDNAITDIRTSTRDLIDRIPDPKGKEMDVYGLVVGRVQSGKTANFTGLIARAVDSGYNLIIVMSGTLNNLRDQTQKRLLRELTGDELHPKGYHINKPENEEFQFQLLTHIGDDDFDGGDLNVLYNEKPKLAVIKKNVDILKKLKLWLDKINKNQRKNIKLLMIDDEADYASVNSKKKRAANIKLRDDIHDSPEDKEDLDASKTNAYVRGILDLFPTRAYIAYTATPYANVMIDPNDDGAVFDFGNGEEKLGKTLYPRNFIRLLDRPEGYVGLNEIFPAKSVSELINVEEVSEREQAMIRNGLIDYTPELEDAILSFIVSGSIRKKVIGIERWESTHHTMMVHVTHEVKIMRPIAIYIDDYIRNLAIIIEEDWESDYDDLIDKIEKKWFSLEPNINFDLDIIKEFMNEIRETRLINSEKEKIDEEKEDRLKLGLDFDTERIIGVIVGGNLLSRGLTVEGLTTSYFIRPSSTYESAIQMCRWNGIRDDLQKKLIRVYMTENMRKDYQWLNLVEKDLREEVMHYCEKNKTPSDFAVRILCHVVEGRARMNPTNRSKMVNVKFVDKGIHRTIQQTRGFLKYTNNSEICKSFINKLDFERMNINGVETTHYHAKNVDFEKVWKFLNEIEMPERGANKEGILGYFKYMNEEFSKNLEKWSVIVIGEGRGSETDLGNGVEIKLSTRSRNSQLKEDEEFFEIPELVTDQNVSLDLQPDMNLIDEKGNYNRKLMFDMRRKNQPLLLIYLLDPNYTKNSQVSPYYEEKDDGKPEFVVAPAFVLPDARLSSEDEEKLRAYYRLQDMPGSGR